MENFIGLKSNKSTVFELWREISNNVVCATHKGLRAVWSEPLLVAWLFYEY